MKTFEELYPDIMEQIDKRRGAWRLASTPWEDVRQIVVTRVWVKFNTFDPEKGEFSHWLSRLITNSLKNILRDFHLRWSRPCVQGCSFNTGGNGCSKTPSKTQCNECHFYKEWTRRKESQFNINQTLTLENHSQEVHNIPADGQDIGEAKKMIDLRMKERLNPQDYIIYKAIYIDGLTDKVAGGLLSIKTNKRSLKMWPNYSLVLAAKKRILAEGKLIIEEEDLA